MMLAEANINTQAYCIFLKNTLPLNHLVMRTLHAGVCNDCEADWTRWYLDILAATYSQPVVIHCTYGHTSLLSEALFTLPRGYSVLVCSYLCVHTSVCECSCSKGSSSTVRGSTWATSPIKPSVWRQGTAGCDGNTTLTTWGRFVTHLHTLSHTPALTKWLTAQRWLICVSLFQALMSLFVLSCKDGWVSIMYDGLDAVAVDQQVNTYTHTHT